MCVLMRAWQLGTMNTRNKRIGKYVKLNTNGVKKNIQRFVQFIRYRDGSVYSTCWNV